MEIITYPENGYVMIRSEHFSLTLSHEEAINLESKLTESIGEMEKSAIKNN